MSNVKIEFFIVGIGISLLPFMATADPAPVVDLSQGGYSSAPTTPNTGDQANPTTGNTVPPLPLVDATNMTVPERMSRVEQQVDNLIQMNMPQQIAELQQQVQQLTGQIQELSH